MANILDTIIATKFEEIKESQKIKSLHQLQDEVKNSPQPRGFIKAIETQLSKNKAAVIAEIKKASPSKGVIRENFNPKEIAISYEKGGATCLSVLTDEKYFQGHANFLKEAKAACSLPILRKDFMVDPYQIIEAKAYGADVILLIAACLTPLAVKELATVAKDIGLEVLLEIHTSAELEHVCDGIDMVGINNRNLKTFEVDLAHSIALAKMLPAHLPKIAESGISDVATIIELKKEGFDGFLMGENFMKTVDPAAAFAAFVAELKKRENEN